MSKPVTITHWPNNPHFSEPELAQLVGVSTRLLKRLRSEGKLSFSRIGDKVIYTRADWEEYVRNSRRAATGWGAARVTRLSA